MPMVPGHVYFNAAAQVKDTHRIETQSLRLRVRDCGLLPRVPGHTIAFDSATAELLWHLSKRHIEVASQEVNAKTLHKFHETIPEVTPLLWPFYLHGVEMPMHSGHHDIFPKMANVLFEAYSAHMYPRPRHFIFFVIPVVVVSMNFVKEALQGMCDILSNGNQNSRLFIPSRHPVLVIMCFSRPAPRLHASQVGEDPVQNVFSARYVSREAVA